jgi:hypothetical protein
MKTGSFARLANAIVKPVVAVALSLPLLAAAQAGPSFAGPSVTKVSDTAVFCGSGYPATAAVSITVTLPGGAEATYGAVAGPDGKLSYSVAASTAGVYVVKVLSSSGSTLSTVNFLAMQ